MAKSTFKTIHIFGYGEVQLIGGVKDGKVSSANFESLNTFVNHIKTFKPENVEASDLHVIHIFKDGDVRYLGKNEELSLHTKKSYSVNLSQVDSEILDNFVNDLIKAIDANAAPAEA